MNIYEPGSILSGSNVFATCDTIWGLMDCSQIAVSSPFPPLPCAALLQSPSLQYAPLLRYNKGCMLSNPTAP